jgi:hypothetical protein
MKWMEIFCFYGASSGIKSVAIPPLKHHRSEEAFYAFQESPENRKI